VGLGLTWLATVPPTAAIVGKLFGVRYLATLFGLTLLSHQIGGSLGAYLDGIALAQSGDYHWMWYADMALAAAAAHQSANTRGASRGLTHARIKLNRLAQKTEDAFHVRGSMAAGIRLLGQTGGDRAAPCLRPHARGAIK